MEPASLLRFVAIGAATWLSVAATVGTTVLVLRPWLRRFGPSVERVAAATALVAGPVVAVALVGLLVTHSALAPLTPAGDHCLDHPHIAHLCLRHAGAATGGVTIDLLAVASLTAAVWIAVRKRRRDRTKAAAVSALAQAASPPVELPGVQVLRVDSAQPFCIVTGPTSRPRILVSTAAWSAVSPEERDAMLAHELSHVRHGDLSTVTALGWCAALGFPGIGRRLLQGWRDASERLADRAAARSSSPSAVAAALLAITRASRGPAQALPAQSIASPADSHAPPNQEQLDPTPDSPSLARRASVAVWTTTCVGLLLAARHAATLHHHLERLLGTV